MQAQVTQALRPAYEELAAALPSQQYLGIDESPTKEAATKAWLWTFVAGLFTVFAVRGGYNACTAPYAKTLRMTFTSSLSTMRTGRSPLANSCAWGSIPSWE